MPLATFYATKTPSHKEILSDCVSILVTVQHPHLTSPSPFLPLSEGDRGRKCPPLAGAQGVEIFPRPWWEGLGEGGELMSILKLL